MNGLVVTKVLSKQLIVQTFVEEKIAHLLNVLKSFFFLLYTFQTWCVIFA